MALGEITKQLAQQALGNQMKDVLDSLRPPDLSSISEGLRGAKPPAGPGDNAGATILGQIQAMQNALKEDQELVVLAGAGAELIRVLEIFVPSWRVLVLTGIDANRNVTRIVSPVEAAQLFCKVMRAQPQTKPVRINFIAPKP
jgi:hypothetical protein